MTRDDGSGTGWAGDLGEAQVVQQRRAGDVRRGGLSVGGALQYPQGGLVGRCVVAQHDAVDAGALAVRKGKGQGLGLPHDDAVALKPGGVYPAHARADGHGQAARRGDGEILLAAVHARRAGGGVPGSVGGVVVDAVEGVSNDVAQNNPP